MRPVSKKMRKSSRKENAKGFFNTTPAILPGGIHGWMRFRRQLTNRK